MKMLILFIALTAGVLGSMLEGSFVSPRNAAPASCFEVGEKQCGELCIPLSYICCPDGKGGCPGSHGCQLAENGVWGCCPIGQVCHGSATATTNTMVINPTGAETNTMANTLTNSLPGQPSTQTTPVTVLPTAETDAEEPTGTEEPTAATGQPSISTVPVSASSTTGRSNATVTAPQSSTTAGQPRASITAAGNSLSASGLVGGLVAGAVALFL
ncbi:hypothetical protein DCS_03457 [Drechmeria coniospora]|uniref:GPI anchored serine-threonine rich protein n=1 Tax=Drechmeria coniospora TaxID=98403 RepID=A0A151GH65_DRECN|nr:hypothetical protein DCS_03457 [Drechmeria coniospora]KYK56457.1 hypothetical protein DCS_03457 [Drechmeria coniospora]